MSMLDPQLEVNYGKFYTKGVGLIRN